jgi:hypothetical protein
MFKGFSSPPEEDSSIGISVSKQFTFIDRQHSTASHQNIPAEEQNFVRATEQVVQSAASSNTSDSFVESATKVPILTSPFSRVGRKLDNMGQ